MCWWLLTTHYISTEGPQGGEVKDGEPIEEELRVIKTEPNDDDKVDSPTAEEFEVSENIELPAENELLLEKDAAKQEHTTDRLKDS